MAEDSDLERTEDATPRRIEQAREKGQVPRSQELSTFVVLLAGLLALIFMGDALLAMMREAFQQGFVFKADDLAEPRRMMERLFTVSLNALTTTLPLMLVIAVTALLAQIGMGGWLFSWDIIGPNFSKLNPFAGVRRIFSMHSLGEMIKAIMKALLIGGVGFWVIWSERRELLGLIAEPFEPALWHLAALVKHTLLWVVGSLILLVIFDVPFQLWQYYKGLRMTKEEVKQEMKESDGDPQIKARIRQLQRETARRRMMQAVPKADVIVTNPTHYAVAIQYDQSSMKAPVVVAKGAFRVAEQIVGLAKENHIAILRVPPFARALYFHAKIDREIPVELFQATAEVLAYIYRLRVYEASGGMPPEAPVTLPVPPDLDPGEAAEVFEETPDLMP